MEVKPQVLCDSDVIIELLNDNHAVTQKIIEFGFNHICVSVITVNEILLGASNKMDQRKLSKWVSQFNIIDLDRAISNELTALTFSYGLSHRPQIPDLLIASTAIIHDFDLFTLNIKDFIFIPKLRLINHDIKPVRIKR